MTTQYTNHKFKFYYSYSHIVDAYGTVEKYVEQFIDNNKPIVVSHKIIIDRNTMMISMVLDGKECYKEILQYGVVELWMHPTRIVQIPSRNLST